MKIKSILVSQPEPASPRSPYFELAEKHNIRIDFRPFIQVEGIVAKEFRQNRIHILEHGGVIFNSRTSIDHYFRISQELRLTIPDSMKYFCINENTAFYLQKYIVYRKRRIFYGDGKFCSLITHMKKHKGENFLVPLSDNHTQEIPELLDKEGFKYTKAILYRTVCSDLSDLENINYDILVFFSPSGIKSLFQNFPDFRQNHTRIACYGPTTAQAVRDAGLKLDIEVQATQALSMPSALDQYIQEQNKVS